MSELYAHTPGPNGWHNLDAHLEGVAEQARAFAEQFGAAELAYWLGILHDIGKVNPAFQEYLQAQAEGRRASIVPHAVWGAALVYHWLWKQRQDPTWVDLALPIVGHHAGLYDAGKAATYLHVFLEQGPQSRVLMSSYLKGLKVHLPKVQLSGLPSTRRELRIRMLFSALVDADYLDTEAHFNPEKVTAREGWPNLEELWQRFEIDQEQLLECAEDTQVNRIRREVYQACLKAASGPPGVYRLTVPTGGGKTRSSLAFALKHASANGLRRVVVAIPYTSIIDQTAQVYREILGEGAVLEHHSQVEYPADETQDPQMIRARLASENWDAPLIVTTTVQLFESLFSNRPSRVRKLHNLARSVIILDEVQTLPPELLEPALDVLRTLVEQYDVSAVLSTATQPTFEESRFLKSFHGLEVREIVPEYQYQRHFAVLRRVRYEFRKEPLSWTELADELRTYPQAMVVLNARKDALALLDALGDDPHAFHLSTLLCGAHRRALLAEIKRRLKAGEPVHLVSTQVVEAGVDLDFPVVYRAVGPLDRIVQAAGRCNREGSLPKGRVVIFEPTEGGAPRGPYRVGIEKARLVLKRHSPEALHNPEIYREYFRELFNTVDVDKKKVQSYREELNYPEVAKRFRLIEDDTVPVVVNYGDGLKRAEEWQHKPSRRTWQRLQPYVVGVYQYEAERMEQEGWLEPLTEGVSRWKGQYDNKKGLVEALYDPSDLIP